MIWIDLRRGRKYRPIIAVTLAAFILFWILGATGGGNYFLSAMVDKVRKVPIYSVEQPEKKIAISFDATWGAERTLQILDILDAHNVKATFFLVNIWLEEYPQMTREIARRGHEIGMHSVSHPHFSTLSKEEITQELLGNQNLIEELVGTKPTLFRPPFGDYNNLSLETAEELGITTIQWSVDSLDWKDLSAAEIQERVLGRAGSGDIVLFHNNGLHTAEALEGILTQFEQDGLQLVPIGELLLPADTSYIDFNGVQRPSNQSQSE